MRRAWWIWLAFGGCLAVVFGAMGWMSLLVWRLEQTELRNRREAAVEQRARLALWRIDSTLSSLITQESARPYFVYRSLVTVERPFDNMYTERKGSERVTASPLLAPQHRSALVYFQFAPDGTLTSPQIPPQTNRDVAVPRWTSDNKIASAQQRLAELGKEIGRDRLAAVLNMPPVPPPEVAVLTLNRSPEEQRLERTRRSSLAGRGQDYVEYELRNQAVQQSANSAVFSQNELQQKIMVRPPTDVDAMPMKPLWIDGRLILARRLTIQGGEYLQGCLLDWPTIKASLLETISDVLPEADLQPVANSPLGGDPRMAAAIPIRLEPNLSADDDGLVFSPILMSLGLAWLCAAVAALAGAGLMLGVMRLADRRTAFVHAVTHELRTPLTTFQMYAEMLAEGMVPEPAQQQRYLGTLRAEAVRLTHLVENVLSYARLERGRHRRQAEELPLDDLVGRMFDRLAARAAQSGMELVWENGDALGQTLVRANVSAVEQILFNLVDNACKYAASATDKTIRLSFDQSGGSAAVRIADHGPGIATAMRRRLFRSFSKSAQEAAQSAPGIGLGLALSRRLARDMGGDLTFEPGGVLGASFLLSLPVVR